MVVDYEEILEKAVESFFSGKYQLSKNYFAFLNSNDNKFSHIAYFGIICIDSIISGYTEAKDLFKYFLLSDYASQKNMIEYFFDHEISYEEFSIDEIDYNNQTVILESLQSDTTYSDIMLGEIFEKMGDTQKALDYLTKALQKRPFDNTLRKKVSNLGKKS
ncbi:MAG: tetratricopeptide repeat protein [Desulfurella sp.]|jgi:tetratricopeptide (TPR) repeat protein